MWSGYFRILFYGDFKEANQDKEDKIVLEEMKAELFEQFLDAVYPCRVPIKEDMIPAMMSLADRFDSPYLFRLADDLMYDAVRKGRMSAFVPLSTAGRLGMLDICDRYLETFPTLQAFMRANKYDEITNDVVFTWVYKKFSDKEISDAGPSKFTIWPSKRIHFNVKQDVTQQFSVILTNNNDYPVYVTVSPNGAGLTCSNAGIFLMNPSQSQTIYVYHKATSNVISRDDIVSFKIQVGGRNQDRVLSVEYHIE